MHCGHPRIHFPNGVVTVVRSRPRTHLRAQMFAPRLCHLCRCAGALEVRPLTTVSLPRRPLSRIGVFPLRPLSRIGVFPLRPLLRIGAFPRRPLSHVGTLSLRPLSRVGALTYMRSVPAAQRHERPSALVCDECVRVHACLCSCVRSRRRACEPVVFAHALLRACARVWLC
jgi:hypothetical protein